MLGWVLLKKVSEGNGASREDDFVRLDLLSAITGEGDVHKLGLIPQVCEGGLDTLLEVVPSQTKLLLRRGSHFATKAKKALVREPPSPSPWTPHVSKLNKKDSVSRM